MKEVGENISLKSYNTFGLDAYAKYFAEPCSKNEIKDLLQSHLKDIQPKLILGEGSNILFNGDFNGLIIKPSIKGIEIIKDTSEQVYLRVGSGENWDGFVQFCVENNYGGIENLSFIPGTVGASPVQNIGAYGVEVKDLIDSVETIDSKTLETKIFHANECQFGYRTSLFKETLKNRSIITMVVFRLEKEPRFVTHYGSIGKELDKYPETNIKNIREVVVKIRKQKLPDPKELGNAGSFFKNPVVSLETLEYIKKFYPKVPYWESDSEKVKLSAAWLIETCQWKSKKIGDAGTYRKQPLVIVNYGHASANDILTLAGKIQKAVKNHFAIQLEPEVNII
ncbi:MAG: UDP-N-acetylmuramate dehydrogenase [Bacteroidales bacterium]|nr:UDP-N-acetylmuramate dehydrogenase [Bacteroidales bacterium]